MKCFEVMISFPAHTWKSLAMLTDEDAIELRQRLVELECDGKIQKGAWHIHSIQSPHTKADLDKVINDATWDAGGTRGRRLASKG
jgi:hypothetical protein